MAGKGQMRVGEERGKNGLQGGRRRRRGLRGGGAAGRIAWEGEGRRRERRGSQILMGQGLLGFFGKMKKMKKTPSSQSAQLLPNKTVR